jgi:hypothetical protein
MGRQGLSTTEGEHGVSLSDSSVTCIDPRRGQAASFRKAREMVLAQQDGGAHHGVTELGDAPAARAGILARIPRRCRRLRRRETCALRGDRCSRGAEEAHPQLTVAQVLEGVFAAEDGGEEGEVGGRRGIGRMRRAAVAIPQGAARGARGCDRRARDRRRRRGRRGSGGWPPWRRRRSAGDTPRPLARGAPCRRRRSDERRIRVAEQEVGGPIPERLRVRSRLASASLEHGEGPAELRTTWLSRRDWVRAPRRIGIG